MPQGLRDSNVLQAIPPAAYNLVFLSGIPGSCAVSRVNPGRVLLNHSEGA